MKKHHFLIILTILLNCTNLKAQQLSLDKLIEIKSMNVSNAKDYLISLNYTLKEVGSEKISFTYYTNGISTSAVAFSYSNDSIISVQYNFSSNNQYLTSKNRAIALGYKFKTSDIKDEVIWDVYCGSMLEVVLGTTPNSKYYVYTVAVSEKAGGLCD